MASELKRHAVRIAANYIRLVLGFVIGIAMVPILLRAAGEDGFGVIGLLGSATGILFIIREVVNNALTREVGAAYHEGAESFREHYASAIVLSAVVAGVTFVLYLGLIFVLPLLNIPDALMNAARWMIVIQSFEVLFRITTAAPINLLLVQERFVAHNVVHFMRKFAEISTGIAVLLAYQSMSASAVLILYAIVASSLNILLQILAVGWLIHVDRSALPRLRFANRTATARIVRTAKWNVAVACATTLHLRIDVVIMNLLFGIVGTSVMVIGIRLTGYMRQLVFGMTDGLDAVAVRMHHKGGAEAIRPLIRYTTRIHALVVVPAALFLIFFADPIIRVWITRALDDPDAFVRDTTLVIQALAIGFASRAISDSWMHIMYGAGHVRRYAPLIAIGAVLNPILGLVFYYVLPQSIAIASIAAGTSTVFFFIHFIGLPVVLRRTLGVPIRDAYAPLIRPTLMALIALPVALVFRYKVQDWTLLWLIATMAAFGLVYAGLCLSFAMDRAERAMFIGILRRRLPPALGGTRIVSGMSGANGAGDP